MIKLLIPLLVICSACASAPTGDSSGATFKVETWQGIKGKMTRLSDGLVFPFEIEKIFGSGTGKIRATDPQTGQIYEGTYSGAIHGGGYKSATVYDKYSRPLGTVSGWERPTGADAEGVMTGGGKVFELYLDIVPGNLIVNPKGHGPARDNAGERYLIQF